MEVPYEMQNQNGNASSGDNVSIIEKAAGRLDLGKKDVAHPSEITTDISKGEKVTVINKPIEHVKESPISKRVEINLSQLHQLGMVTPGEGKTLAAEEFRIIKRPLIKNALNQDAGSRNHSNLIMVTSALPGEGKTFSAINLAMSIAMEMDHTVLLVDADVARPSILRTLGLNAEIGLIDILLDDKIDLADVMLKTNVDTLSILPSGKGHKHATELLASHAMNNLLDQIANRYPDRIVIFDSPPLLLTSEARVLASQMGQIVLVVEAEKTTQNAVKEALHQLEACENVNLIYNKARVFPGGNYYGYY